MKFNDDMFGLYFVCNIRHFQYIQDCRFPADEQAQQNGGLFEN